MGKFDCPACNGKGASVRGERPRFIFEHSEMGSQVDEYRLTLMRCRLCPRLYSVSEFSQPDGWHFDRYTTLEAFYEVEQQPPQSTCIGSTASEWSKRMARGVEEPLSY